MKTNSTILKKVLKSFLVSSEINILRDIYFKNFCYLNILIQQKVNVNDNRYLNCLNYLKTNNVKPGFIFSFSQIIFMKSVGLKNLLAQNENELQVINNVIKKIDSNSMINILKDKIIRLNFDIESLKIKIGYLKTIKTPKCLTRTIPTFFHINYNYNIIKKE
ncbi:hypothetical protein RB653_001958 [Dictyostelium firmibasis]|uniref:Uncharacterized protein n=1 Tax=Dictyostelium firmibasis TaxID=79012 RepID=A0AAN7YPM2_9MYCE